MLDTSVDITARSYHYDTDFRAWIASRDIEILAATADGYRKIAADPKYGTARDLAIAAYYQSVVDRKRAAAKPVVIFMQWHPEQYIDNGGPCGHSDPYTGADGCLCKDDYYIPAYIADGLTPDYCDGEPADRLFAREHAEHCPQHRTNPWF